MSKSADAFRTISEVADWLDTPAHVLRFWESKFTQVKPVKRAGGRRYYRPADMLLLGGIKKLLHEDGLTIKGVQKILRDKGIRHVTAFSQPLDEVTEAEVSAIAQDVSPGKDSATVLHFQRETDGAGDPVPDMTQDGPPETMPDPEQNAQAPGAQTREQTETFEPTAPESETAEASEAGVAPRSEPEPAPEASALPGFLRTRPQDPEDAAPAMPTKESAPAPDKAPIPEASPAPAPLDIPDDPEDGIAAAPGLLAALAELRGPLAAEQAQALRDLVARLTSIGA